MADIPTYSRKYLRQTLGRSHLRDTYVGQTSDNVSQVAYALVILDAATADLSLSGQGLYLNSTMWVTGNEVRVASFNVASGALFSVARSINTVTPSGTEYERHDMLPAVDKNRAIDETIKRLWTRQEVGIDSIEKDHTYPLPTNVIDVLDCYYFASPQGTLDRVQQRLTRFETVVTATGVELRIDPALMASQQIVLDAIVSVSLGSSDAATVNIPDERLVLFGAEAQCWDLMVRKAPRGTADEYRALRNEAARQFNLLSARFKVPIDRPLRLHDPGGQAF